MNGAFSPEESFARALDNADPLRPYRDLFWLPRRPLGPATGVAGAGAVQTDALYLCGNSLGLQPKATRDAVIAELDDWASMGVQAHHLGRNPWLYYHEPLREPLARLVGALPHEVVAMNSLTVNLHLLMASFYRPTAKRHKIVIEDDAFPSDSYAVASQAAWHGYDPATSIVRLKPRTGEDTLRTQDIVDFLNREGDTVALTLMSGVNYLTGEWFDMPAITAAAQNKGCIVGWDLAHAAGNVPLRLHEWNVDFAAWCTYKYLNSGPGAVAGAYVHERHARNQAITRLAGWWGNDPATRFEMGPGFHARPSADGWQLSNPPILSLAPVRVSLEIFDRAGMTALREKSQKLTAYLEFLLDRITNGGGRHLVQVITPRDSKARGCQLSLAVAERAREVHAELEREGVVCDFRAPNVIRVAPTPLYNTYHEVWRFAQIVERMFRN
ncbi:MAG TPA: kynureninase [Phycisphaerales bacterium]|nr:kynureninase [Phycisphaerales bacterium]